MSYNANPKEVESVFALSAFDRYQYLINKVADWEEVWSIANDSGWALYGDERGVEACPIWPAKAFARACCIAEWGDHVAKPISLSVLCEKWLPGLAVDGRTIAVFPLPSDKGIVVEPSRFEKDLREAISQYE